VDADSCFPELLLAVATVDVACRCCTLAIGGGNGVYYHVDGPTHFMKIDLFGYRNAPDVLSGLPGLHYGVFDM
jgi:hypothetical protein